MKCDGERGILTLTSRSYSGGDIVNTLVCSSLLLLLSETSVEKSVGWSLW
jgi:hypothetical protein